MERERGQKLNVDIASHHIYLFLHLHRAELEKMDDIWFEIPTEALNDAMGYTEEDVNL
jgi:hypothetical protein